MKKTLTYYFVSIFALLSFSSSYASHIMGGDLIYQHLGGNQYRIKLTQYRDCSGITPSTNVNLILSSASCGQSISVSANLEAGYPVEVSAICPAQLPNTTCNGGALQGVQEYVYSVITTLPMACTDWVFSWSDCCRNSGISTIANPGSAGTYLEARLNNVAVAGNTSPDFITKPVPYFGINQPQSYSHATVEPDGDVLVYDLITPYDNATLNVTFNAPYSATYPLATASGTFPFNTTTGQMTFTPNTVQNAVMAIRVSEYRGGVLIGSVMRDIQMVILNASNGSTSSTPPSAIVGATLVPGQTNVFSACAGTPMSFQVTASDPNPATVISHSSNYNTAIPGSTLTVVGTNPKTVTFAWTPPATATGANSFSLTFTDNNCPIPSINGLNFVINVLGVEITNQDTGICNLGQPFQFTTNLFGNPIGGYTWTGQGLSANNIANPTASPSVLPATYTVSYNLSGCVVSDNITLVQSTASVRITTPDSIQCSPKSTVLTGNVTGSSGGTLAWSGSGLGSTNTVTTTASITTLPQTYSVTYTSPSGGCVVSDAITVVQSNTLNTSATASPGSICLGGGPVQLNATPITASNSGYTLASIPFAPLTFTGTSLTLGDDQLSAAVPIGFNFSYYSNIYSNVYVSSNGFITFDGAAGSGCCSGQSLPNTSTPNNVIAANWDDMYPPAGGTITYTTLGIAPNRIFVVQYFQINPCCGVNAATDMTAQILLYENGVIEIHATDIGMSNSQTMGIENATGTLATPVTGKNSGDWTSTNEGWRFSPGISYTYAWSPATHLSATNTANPILSTLTTDSVYTVTVTSSEGCVGTSNVTIHKNTTFENSVTPSATPNTICGGAATTVQLGVTPISVGGTYSGNAPYTVSSIAHAPISGSATTVTLGDDQVSAALPIGFSFTFYGNTYTDFYISSNGFITFDGASSSGCCSGDVTPSTATPNNKIALCHNDLYPPAGGSISYFTTGTAPNRMLVVNYNMIGHCCSANPNNTGQIVLYESTFIIDVFATNITSDGSNATLGIENAAGTLATTPAGRNGVTWTATNEGWRFTSANLATHSYLWSPATNLSSTSIHNPVVSAVPSTITYNVQVTELATGCTANKSVTLTVASPITPVVTSSTYCNSASLTVSNPPSAGTINWYSNNTGTGTPLGTGTTYTATTPGTYYAFNSIGTCLGPVSNGTTVNVGMGNLWTQIPNPAPPVTATQNYYADASCYDPISGLTYFYQAGPQRLLMASSYMLPAGVTLVNHPPLNASEMAVRLDILPGYASGVGEFISAPTAPYVQNPNGWYVMHRTWDVMVHTANQLTSPKTVRFFFSNQDRDDVSNPSGHLMSSFEFYKLITGLNPSNPANHLGVTGSQISVYSPGGVSTTTWALGTDATTGANYADYMVTSFSGGGGGAGSIFPSPLPAMNLVFSGKNIENVNYLKWTVEEEINTLSYDVERAPDGWSFAKIGTVPATHASLYSFQDQYPVEGINYYRLKMWDNDGKTFYSNTIQLGYSLNSFKYALYPNPATTDLHIDCEGVQGEVIYFSLYNELGQEVYRTQWDAQAQSQHTLKVDAIAKGVYFYKIRDEVSTLEGKWVKD